VRRNFTKSSWNYSLQCFPFLPLHPPLKRGSNLITTQLEVGVEDRAYDQLEFDEWHSACLEARRKECEKFNATKRNGEQTTCRAVMRTVSTGSPSDELIGAVCG
jgi:hypothetical protein